MTTEDLATFNGKYYQIDGAINQPKPIQKPYPPLWVCGGGEKVTLKLLAKYGDYGNWDVDLDGFIRKSNILKEHCDKEDRDFSSIGRTLHTDVVIAKNDTELKNLIEKVADQRNIEASKLATRPLVGTVKDHVYRDAVDASGRSATVAADDTWILAEVVVRGIQPPCYARIAVITARSLA